METILKKPIILMLTILLLSVTNYSYADSEFSENSALEWVKKTRLGYRNLIPDEYWEEECQRKYELEAKQQKKTKPKSKIKVAVERREYIEDCMEVCFVYPECDIANAGKIAEEFVFLLKQKCETSIKDDIFVSLLIIGKPAVEPLIKVVQDEKNFCILITAIEILGEMGSDAKSAEKVLVKILHKANGFSLITNGFSDGTRVAAAKALIQIGPSKAVVNNFVSLLDDGNASIRKYSAIALGKISPPASIAVPKLLRLAVGDEDFIVRMAAVSAVGNIGPGARSATPILAVIMDASERKPKKKRTLEEQKLSLYAAKSLLQINPKNRGPANKIISSINPDKEDDFASYLLFKLGDMVKPDIERALLREKKNSEMHRRLWLLIKRIEKRSWGYVGTGNSYGK